MAKQSTWWFQQVLGGIKKLAQPRRQTGLTHALENSNHAREFIVIGLGRFGTSLAMTLNAYGHDVLAIDADMKRVQMVSQNLPHVVQLDATSIDALREVGAEMFDTGVVCIGSDFESNLLATVVLRKLGVRRVVTKATTVTQQEILSRVGADQVILPEHEAGVRLARKLAAIDFVDFLELTDDTGIVEMVTPGQFAGKSLREADIRNQYGLAVIAIKRGEQIIISPPATEVMLEDDILVILGKTADCERLRQ
ncbi:MAG: Ktr system potassium uptake protein A [Anaerolineae bacterium]|nr:Ktr system potassium uptake protein A [Anaerolineae bacterium]